MESSPRVLQLKLTAQVSRVCLTPVPIDY